MFRHPDHKSKQPNFAKFPDTRFYVSKTTFPNNRIEEKMRGMNGNIEGAFQIMQAQIKYALDETTKVRLLSRVGFGTGM